MVSAIALGGFKYTTKLYNGTADFAVLYNACNEFAFSSVCSNFLLTYGQFWTDPVFLKPAWILDINYNCGGDASYAVGKCIMWSQETTCTCDMNLPVCCFVN